LRGPGSAHLRDATVAAKHILADGDLVAVRTHVATPQGDLATVDLFQVAGGKIVEHWDVVQPVPAEMLHPHGMF
jgi:predicted SnoaL-like aldol condensation-catalyzing enzyme